MASKITLPIYADELQQALVDRLSRAEGQVRGVARMVEEQRPCLEVLQQLASVQAAGRARPAVRARAAGEAQVAALRTGEATVAGTPLGVGELGGDS